MWEKTDGILKEVDYLEILKQNLQTLVKDDCIWDLQRDKNPKHTSKSENVWTELKKWV